MDVISVCTRPGQHVTDRLGPYQPQVPGAKFGLGVRWRLVLTSIGIAANKADVAAEPTDAVVEPADTVAEVQSC